MTVADLKRGEKARITHFSENTIPLKLMEMGCLPGNEVQLLETAPYSDPIYLNVNGTHLAIRKEVASKIPVESE